MTSPTSVAFQLGFCVFVLSNYMRVLPKELDEAAVVDGAGVWTRFWRLTPPLCRPALANLQGQFVANQNMIAAAALIAAIPTLIVYQ
ncbi:ABC transporter permease subunit [Micromonospora sp. LH3U1]|uniref:ABC transporter permease subunit n=1 Tax=Micromonospora sp. LH3U1 TaxID=3018339 RepID=UPI00234AD275|nr:ABC transporter permease subunit [Micromonospora sp. LH3U1]WCN84687.1 ABC transporter permease subunit [Micromonospora sp. LH3U1]